MTVLIDTDVLIDVALDRSPFAESASNLLDRLEQNPGNAYVAWHSIANFYYLVRPTHGSVETKRFILDLIEFVEIAETGTQDLSIAAHLNMQDFEDAMQAAAALAYNAEVVVTRNLPDYANAPVRAITPAQLLATPFLRKEE